MQGKQLRSIEGHEAVKAFERAGGTVRRGKGSHINIKMPNGQLITIPATGEVKIGLLKAAIRKAGLTEEEFINYCEVSIMDYTVIIHKAEEGGYWVEVPALSGCFSQGETIEETLQNVQEAIALHLEVLAEEGQEAPQDEGWFIARVPALAKVGEERRS